MKLYYHETSTGAKYLTDKFIKNPNGTKEGDFKGSKYIIRLDDNLKTDAELIIKEQEKPKGKASHTDKINELIEGYATSLKTECARLLKSGGIDPESFNPEEYALAKIVLTAAIKRTANAYYPTHDKNLQREIKNLEHF